MLPFVLEVIFSNAVKLSLFTLTLQSIEKRLRKRLNKESNVYIWGAGIHTSQFLANTDLRKWLLIEYLIDSSPTKWGKKIGDLECLPPESCDFKKGDSIIISSYASEEEIYDSLAEYRNKGVIVERLHGENKQ